MIGRYLWPRPSAFRIWTSHLRTPSARRPACPFGWSCSGIDRAFPALVVTTKLLAYEVCVYLALCPVMLVTLWPPTLTAFVAFTSPATLWPFPTFAACPDEFRLAIHPCSRETTVTTLILFFPTTSHIRGITGVQLWWRFSSLRLFPT